VSGLLLAVICDGNDGIPVVRRDDDAVDIHSINVGTAGGSARSSSNVIPAVHTDSDPADVDANDDDDDVDESPAVPCTLVVTAVTRRCVR